MLAIHCIGTTDASRPAWMAGSATLMTDAWRDATLDPRTVAARTHFFAWEAQPGVSLAPRSTPASQGGCARLSMVRRSEEVTLVVGPHARVEGPSSPVRGARADDLVDDAPGEHAAPDDLDAVAVHLA